MNHRYFWMVLSAALCAVGATLLVFPAFASVAKSGAAAVSFHAVGPGGLAIVGKSSNLSVREEAGSRVVFTSQLDQLTTGIGLRDSHMREKYLETQRFPTASLTVERSLLKFPKTGSSEGDIPGQLTLHGVTKRVSIHYEGDGGEKAADFDGTTTIDMTEFGIRVPSYLGVTVKPRVKIVVKLKLTN